MGMGWRERVCGIAPESKLVGRNQGFGPEGEALFGLGYFLEVLPGELGLEVGLAGVTTFGPEGIVRMVIGGLEGMVVWPIDGAEAGVGEFSACVGFAVVEELMSEALAAMGFLEDGFGAIEVVGDGEIVGEEGLLEIYFGCNQGEAG